MNSFLKNWKSTVSGLLTTTLATSAAFLAPPLNALVSPKVILYIGAAQIIGSPSDRAKSRSRIQQDDQ